MQTEIDPVMSAVGMGSFKKNRFKKKTYLGPDGAAEEGPDKTGFRIPNTVL